MQILTAEQTEIFILTFLRVSAMIITIPILGDVTVPARVKVGLALLISFLIFPFVQTGVWRLSSDIFSLILRMAGEIMIGVMVGFAGRLIFDGIQLAGQLIGFQMGFSIVNVIDPVNNEQVSIISQFQYLIAMLIFLVMNGHHIFLYAIAESFRILPPLGFHFSGELMQLVLVFVRNMLEVAIKTGAPIIAVLLFMSVGMGLVARTVPQINIFIVGFPLQIAIGLIGIGVTLPIFLRVVEGYFSNLEGEIISLLRLM
ncbi:MAG TPA: flagellar biosynthetic protein FliR [Syntrophales bacterium]|nr:flagellar biosynthetic protein FliR [Syntrophales bacterium]